MHLPENGTILFLSPHPDDEIISSGALLSYLINNGNSVIIRYLTSGSNIKIASERENEAERVCSRLGAHPAFHRWTRDTSVQDAGDVIAELIIEIDPDLLFMPHTDDPHPTHTFTHNVVKRGLMRSLFCGPILFYSIWQPMGDPDVLFRFSENGMKGKLELLNFYTSQIEKHDFPAAFKGLNRFSAVMAFSKIATWQSNGSNPNLSFVNLRSDTSGLKLDAPIKSDQDEIIPDIDDGYAEVFKLQAPTDGPSVLCLGDVFLDILPEPIELSSVETSTKTSIKWYLGGNAGNTALGLTALGTPTTLYSVIGDDPAGDRVNNIVDQHSTKYHFSRKPGETTATTIAIASLDGSRHFISDFGCLTAFGPEDLPYFETGQMNQFKHLHRAGYFWLPRLRGDPNHELLRFARKCGLTTSLDVGTPIGLKPGATDWSREDSEEVKSLLPSINILFGNEDEIRGISGVDTSASLHETAAILLDHGVEMVVAHLGERGGGLFTKHGQVMCPARKIIPENPTGAGDVFNAAFIHGFFNKWSLENCLEFAVNAGTIHVENRNDPYPTIDRILSSIDRERASRLPPGEIHINLGDQETIT